METRVGLIGCGRWGRNILRDLRALECRVVVADPSAQAREAALRLGAEQAVRSSADIIDSSCAGYIVASPVLTLPSESEAMLRRGKPVFCEKPVFRSMEEKEKLLAAGGDQNLFAMYKFCYHPGVEVLCKLANSAELGEMESIELARSGWDDDLQGTDVLWFVAVHQISIAWRILRFIPEPESADFSYHDGVIIGASICLGKNQRISIKVSSRHPIKSVSAALYCSNGSALLPDLRVPKITIRRNQQPTEQRSLSTEMPLLAELKEFVGYLNGGPKPRCDFEMAAGVSAAVHKIARLDAEGA